ncbi:hypothetical protein BDC45DRAFT_564907 [Circinella umbellata]|nr:hypothetical protein BDC45DRAFT_564907 [Circinella umbellata]
MPRKTSGPKLFRCTGHGDCDMVFTRSEHLARHERKHTGEKPFKCIVPGCERMFSRYDNMMQHTRTHEREREQDNVRIQTLQEPQPQQQQQQQRQRRSSMIQTRTLPPPVSLPSFSQQQQKQQIHQVVAVPSPPLSQYEPHEQEYFGNTGGSTSFEYFNDPRVMTESNWHQGEWVPKRRRLSAIDLQTPIEHWSNRDNNQTEENVHDMAVDVTSDEYEAIQGFGQFRQKPVIRSHRPESPRPRMQVNLFRQNSLPVQESFQRPSRAHAI